MKALCSPARFSQEMQLKIARVELIVYGLHSSMSPNKRQSLNSRAGRTVLSRCVQCVLPFVRWAFLSSLAFRFISLSFISVSYGPGRRQSNHSATCEAKSPMRNHRGETSANRESISAQPDTEDRTPAPLHRSDNSIRSSLD